MIIAWVYMIESTPVLNNVKELLYICTSSSGGIPHYRLGGMN